MAKQRPMSDYAVANKVLKEIHKENINMDAAKVSDAHSVMKLYVKSHMIKNFRKVDLLFNAIYSVTSVDLFKIKQHDLK